MRFLFSLLALMAVMTGVNAGSLAINGLAGAAYSSQTVGAAGASGVAVMVGPGTTTQTGSSKVHVEHIASQTGSFPTGYTFAQAPVGALGSYFLNALQFQEAYTTTPNPTVKYFGTFSAPLAANPTQAQKDTWWQSLDLLTSIMVNGGAVLWPNAADFHYWPSQVTGTPPTATRTPYDYIVFQMPASFAAQAGVVAYVTWCDPAVNTCSPPSPPGGSGDPQFVGLQGQNYQFHGMADEVFNLVSSPELQMNSLFKFIASGNCEYNNTVCWSHPGTYLGQIAIQYGDEHILFSSGSHSEGMTISVNDVVLAASNHKHHYHGLNTNSTMTVVYASKDEVTVETDLFFFHIVNSDYFFNMDFGIKDTSIIQAGARALAVTGEVCERESHSVLKTQTGKISEQIKATYPDFPLHGLLGQTWRNAVYCGRYFEGIVDDYLTGGLFGNEHTFNHFVSHAGH